MDNVNILLESLISNLKEGIHIVDSKGKTIYYNHAMENIEGMKSEDVMGKEIQEYLRDIEHSTILGSLKSGHTYRDTLQNYSNGAGKIITSVNSTIPVMVDGKVEAVIEIARDMTQIKKLNETICQLENKSKSKKNYYTFMPFYKGFYKILALCKSCYSKSAYDDYSIYEIQCKE